MKPSLNYIFCKIGQVVEGARLEDGSAWRFEFEWISVASADTVARNGFLYCIDADAHVAASQKEGARFACVVREGIASRYAGVPRVVVPESCDMALLFDHVVDEVDRFRHWDEAISEILLGEASLQELLDATFALVPRPMYIADVCWRMLACADDDMNEMSSYWLHEIRHGCLPVDAIERLNASGEYDSVVGSNRAFMVRTKAFNIDYIAKTVKHRGRPLAFFFIINTWGDLGPCEIEVADKLGKRLGHVFGSKKEGVLGGESEQTGLAAVLGSAQTSAKQLASALAATTGWKMTGDYHMAGLRIRESEQGNALSRMHVESLLGSGFDSCVIPGDGMALCAYRNVGDDPEALLVHVDYCARTLGRDVLVGHRFGNFSAAPLYYRQFKLLLQDDGFFESAHPHAVRYDTLVPKMLARWCRNRMPPLYEVDALAAHDAEHGTEYVRTLYMYLMCGCNAVATAGVLYLHRNSLHNRLERIRELSGIDMDDADARLGLMLALNGKLYAGEGAL